MTRPGSTLTWSNVNSDRFSEGYGQWDLVDYDLSRFLGQSIELVFVVRNPPNAQAEALWAEPMIYLKYQGEKTCVLQVSSL
jgi:D-lyxose ketol-isomerase